MLLTPNVRKALKYLWVDPGACPQTDLDITKTSTSTLGLGSSGPTDTLRETLGSTKRPTLYPC